mgnify:CR=1 FL=1
MDASIKAHALTMIRLETSGSDLDAKKIAPVMVVQFVDKT